MAIERRQIFYIKRKFIEPNSIGNEEEIRPVLIFKKYRDNIIFLPITKNNNDESHIEILSISNSFKKSFVKISVLQTFSVRKFLKLSHNSRNKKIPLEDYLKIKKEIIFFLDK